MCCSCEKKMEADFIDSNVDLSLIDPIIDELKEQRGNIIVILQKTQEVYGYLPLDALKYIADKTGNKRAKIYGIATFYAQFRLKPIGRHLILQCKGTACHVNGADSIGKALEERLNIKVGETTEDGFFTLEEAACLGCCSLAPVMLVNGEAYGNLTPDLVKRIIDGIYKGEAGE